jgi:hypothetical protein
MLNMLGGSNVPTFPSNLPPMLSSYTEPCQRSIVATLTHIPSVNVTVAWGLA